MSFFLYDLIFLIIFGSFLAIFLIIRRKKLQRENILILYRTKIGIKIIDYIAKRYKKVLGYVEYLVIFSGYALMIGMLILLFQLLYMFVKFPEIIKAIKIPPLMPLIPYIPKIFNIDFLPPFYFTYWIIVLAIAAISHEFFHGIFAKIKNIEIKSTGFAFLGPFLAFFVEPDEKKVKKLKPKDQLAFLSAGTFANVIMTIIFFFILYLFFVLAFTPSGVIFNTYSSTIVNVSDIKLTYEKIFVELNSGLNLTKVIVNEKGYYLKDNYLDKTDGKIEVFDDSPALKAGLVGVIVNFDGKEIKTNKDLIEKLMTKKPNEEVLIKTRVDSEVKEFKIKLGENPQNKTKAFIGIALRGTGSLSLLSRIRNKILFFKEPNTFYKPKFAGEFIIFVYNLFWWVILINFSVALVNMLPLGIFDGGRVFYLTILAITKSEKFAEKAYKASTYFLLFIFLLLMILWFFGFFG